jgi:hypothetical protein
MKDCHLKFTPSIKFSTRLLVAIAPLLIGATSCPLKSEDKLQLELAPSIEYRYLYFASGACYGGGVTTGSGSTLVSRVNLTTGAKEIILDYTNSPGSSPVGVMNYDSDNLLVGVENTTGRRIDFVNKRGLGRSTYISDTTALSTTLRSVKPLADGGILVTKTVGVERFNSGGGRVAIGANPYINAPAGSCATSTTAMSDAIELSNGKLLFAHAAVTTNNKVGMISSGGYNVIGDCLTTQAPPTTTAMPTAMVYIPTENILLVAYGSTTAGSNSIYAYNVNETTNIISGATLAYFNIAVVNGVSAMAYDSETGEIYVSNATSTFNTIEKFTFNPTTKTLTRVGSTPYLTATFESRCISGMAVGN